MDAYVLSTDDAFTLEAGQAVGERLRMRPIDSPDELPQDSPQPWLVLLDAAQSSAHALVGAIERNHPRAPVIAIVPDAVQAQWLGAVARGSVSAIIARGQLSPVTFGDALVAVERRLIGASPAATGATAAARPAIAARRAPPTAAELFKRSPLARWWPFTAAAALLVIAWLVFGHKPAAHDTAATASVAIGTKHAAGVAKPAIAVPPVTPEPVHRTVLELLSQARIAFRDQSRLLPRYDGSREPRRGESALELYAEVLAQDTGNEEARDGVRRLGSAVQARVQANLAAGQMDDASQLTSTFSAAGGDAALVQKLTSDIKAAQPRWLASQAQRAVAAGDFAGAEQLLVQLNASGGDRRAAQELRHSIDARQADLQLQQMGAEVHSAVAAGALLEPVASSARTRLLAMRQLSRSHSATLNAQRELQLALVARAGEQLKAEQYEAALRWNSAAAELGATDDITDQRRRIRADMDQQAARTAVTATAAAAVETQAPAAARPAYVAAKATRPLNVEYPEALMEKRLVGGVVVEFTLQSNGSATDVTVIESTPSGVFDKAAISAVSRGRFDTAPLGPGKQPQRARLKLSFRP
jgi:TonB family protein